MHSQGSRSQARALSFFIKVSYLSPRGLNRSITGAMRMANSSARPATLRFSFHGYRVDHDRRELTVPYGEYKANTLCYSYCRGRVAKTDARNFQCHPRESAPKDAAWNRAGRR
jgi:hypothetical protein